MTDSQPQAAQDRKTADLGDLHKLLIRACPPDKDGVRSIPILASKLKMSDQAIYGWIERKRVPYRRAQAMVDLNDKRGAEDQLSLEDFQPFM